MTHAAWVIFPRLTFISFRDYELNFVCKDLCYDDLVDCALICGDDTICLADCARVEAECIEGESLKALKGKTSYFKESGWNNAQGEFLNLKRPYTFQSLASLDS